MFEEYFHLNWQQMGFQEALEHSHLSTREGQIIGKERDGEEGRKEGELPEILRNHQDFLHT